MLFANMSEALENSLFGQRVWYKLPSENFGELKMMCNGDVMFDLLVQSTILTKLLNFFWRKTILTMELLMSPMLIELWVMQIVELVIDIIVMLRCLMKMHE